MADTSVAAAVVTLIAVTVLALDAAAVRLPRTHI
jgi:hypothetical protein